MVRRVGTSAYVRMPERKDDDGGFIGNQRNDSGYEGENTNDFGAQNFKRRQSSAVGKKPYVASDRELCAAAARNVFGYGSG